MLKEVLHRTLSWTNVQLKQIQLNVIDVQYGHRSSRNSLQLIY